ncbi:cyclic peptide export ABC transporter [Variovorax boronicumulans]|uniref:cyclic peptide export ABC transporter n=1 Tax=Variovorax boronicumulans TaxID=436515 RepID=UPI003394098C
MLIRRYIRAHARTLVLLSALSGLTAGISILLLRFLNERAGEATRGAGAEVALQGCGLLLAMLLVRSLSARVVAAFGSRLMAELRHDLSQRFLALDPEHLLQRKHAIFGALIGDIARLAPLVQVAPSLLSNVLLAVLGMGYLIHLSPAMFAVVAPFIALSGTLFYITQRLTNKSFDKMRSADESLYKLMRTLVEGKKELTLIQPRASHFSTVQLAPAIECSREAHYRTGLIWGIINAFGDVIAHGWVLAAILAGGWWLGESQTLILQFVIAGLFLSGPIQSIFDLGAQFSSGTSSMRHLESLGLDLERGLDPSPPKTTATPDNWQSMALEGVTYAYPDAATTGYQLGPIDLQIARGQTLFISGGNGSGKSTLLLLLCGLMLPASGTISVDGLPVGRDELERHRSRFSAVFFDFMLFSHVIDDQGRQADPADVVRWLRKVELDAKVDYRDGVLSSIDLSQGQRKRLAFLQSCLDDRDILILDEITADQDRGFREKFYLELLPQLKRRGKTLIVVTHDDRYWHCADRIVTLDCGRLHEAPDAAHLGALASNA